MKMNFKKAILLSVALMTSLSSYALSTGGAWAVGLGTAAAVGLLSWGIAKSHKKDKERRGEDTSRKADTKKQAKRDAAPQTYKASTKDIKQQIADKKRMKKEQRLELKKLEKRGKGDTIEAQNRRSEISKLTDDIHNLKQSRA